MKPLTIVLGIISALILIGGSLIVFTASSPSSSEIQSATFVRSLNQTSHGYQMVNAPHPVRYGDTAERFEVRPGDCARKKDWDDCTQDRERSELSQKNAHAIVGGTYWYGWSIFIPDTFPDISPTKTTLGQLHQKNTSSPPFMFLHKNDGYWLDQNQTKPHARYCNLIPAQKLKNRWHDVVIQVRWSQKMDGFIKVWINDTLKCQKNGPTSYASSPIYLKYGIYRSFLKHYKDKYNVERVPSQTVYFDEVHLGTKRQHVDIRMIEKNGAPETKRYVSLP